MGGPRVIEGSYVDSGGRFAIVAARFNDAIVKELVDGCVDGLRRHGVDPAERIDLVWVPGCFEIGPVCQRLAASGKYAAVVALGAVIRGATTHYDLVSGSVASAVAQVGASTGVPTIFGVLTTESIEQAWERAGTKAGNNGWKAALAALEMASLTHELER
ncbi:MAG: 6,7-dimethyl-8-ribityllumazine synthase [Myxococcota bacterium]